MGLPSPNANTTADMIIGKDVATGLYPFHGTIDDIALYNRALSLSEINQIISPCDTVNITSNIVAQFDFNNNANDISGNNHNGTVSAATLTTDRFGNTNNAYAFNGSTSTITVPDDTTLRLSNTDYTISGWINQTNVASTNAVIISKHTGAGQRGYLLNVSGTGTNPPRRLIFNVSSNTDPKAISDSIISINSWHHVVEVYQLSSHTIYTYIDGLLNSSKANIPSLNPTTAADMYFGSDGVGLPFYFNGKIDDIRIYNRALSSCDVDSLYILPYNIASGLSNFVANNVAEIYPNPAKDYFTISNVKQGNVFICNAFGQLVKCERITATTNKVDIAQLPAGIYFVSIYIDQHQTISRKIIKY
jgi:hypothetical protein